jgi:hypothetical protein
MYQSTFTTFLVWHFMSDSHKLVAAPLIRLPSNDCCEHFFATLYISVDYNWRASFRGSLTCDGWGHTTEVHCFITNLNEPLKGHNSNTSQRCWTHAVYVLHEKFKVTRYSGLPSEQLRFKLSAWMLKCKVKLFLHHKPNCHITSWSASSLVPTMR